MRRLFGFLTNLVAGIVASPGAHPVVDTNTDGVTGPARRKPRRPRRR